MQKRSAETRNQILSASIRLFCRSGYDATGVAEICTAAGVSKGAFYHHFPSKQQLFLAIVDQWLQGINYQLQSFRTPGKTVPQSMIDMADTLGMIFQEASGQLPMFMEFMVQASRDKAVWNASIAPYRQYQNQFAQLLQDGVKEGSLNPELDADTSAWILIAFAIGMLLQGIVVPDAADWEKVSHAGIKMILEGMQRSKT
jgi:AcrR family transcriptional regulator